MPDTNPKTIYWITFGPCKQKSQTTNIQFPGSKRDLTEAILYILSLQWDAWEFGEDAIQKFPNLEEVIFPEQVCYLLQKFYDATNEPNPQSERIEIDLYDVWNLKRMFFPAEEIETDLAECLINPELMAGINHRRYKPGLAQEVYRMTLHGFENYPYTAPNIPFNFISGKSNETNH